MRGGVRAVLPVMLRGEHGVEAPPVPRAAAAGGAGPGSGGLPPGSSAGSVLGTLSGGFVGLGTCPILFARWAGGTGTGTGEWPGAGAALPPPLSAPQPPRLPLTRLSARRRGPLRSSLRRRLRRRVPAEEAAPQPHHLHPAAGRSLPPELPPGLPPSCPLSSHPASPLPGPPHKPWVCRPQAPRYGCPQPAAPPARLPCPDIFAFLPSTSSKPWKQFLLKPTTPMCSLGKSWR